MWQLQESDEPNEPEIIKKQFGNMKVPFSKTQSVANKIKIERIRGHKN